MSQTILVVAEQRNGALRPAAFEAATVGRTIADAMQARVVAVVIGHNVASLGAALGEYGVDAVVAYDHPDLALVAPDAYAACIAHAATAAGASVVVGVASAMGKDVLPRAAARLGAGMLSDATAVSVNAGALHVTRPVYAGKALATLHVKTPVAVVAVRPKVFTAKKASSPTSPSAEAAAVSIDAKDLRMRTTSVQAAASGVLDVAEADVIVSGGRSLKSAEGFGIIEDLAKVLHAAVGASRAAVDAGYRPHRDQVGLTGKVVSPSLYIAVGISGAIQHLAGMSGSKVIVAINKDPEAPMMKKATYAVSGDLFEVVPALTAELQRVMQH